MTDIGVNSVTSLNDQVAEEVRVLLARRRMSQRQLAQRMQVSPAWLNYRLTGVQAIDLNDLQRIAAALDVRVSELWPRDGSGNTLWYSLCRERTTPNVSPAPAGPLSAAPDRPTAAASRPPRGPRHAPTGPGTRRPAVLPRPTAA